MNLLIVDDHAGARALIRELTAEPGDRVCECASGDAALEALAGFVPDWVTVDLLMPGLNGFSTVQAIHRACPSALVLVVSSYADPDFRTAAIEQGAVAFVAKDQLEHLRDWIRPH